MNTAMPRRELGKSGLSLPAIGLGTMGMTGVAGMANMYGTPDEAESLATVHRALELGINFFDTAEVYGPWSNETLLAKALGNRRREAIIASKFGFKLSSDGKMQGLDGSPANARRVLDASLQRLGTDYIDLWYLHRYDRSVPIEETVGAMAEGVRAGKVRHIGLSEVGVSTLRRAHAVHPIAALQSEYSIWERNIEDGVIACCRELGIGIVPYSPLGRGFLTGAVANAETLPDDDYRRLDPRFLRDNFARNQAIIDAVTKIAAAHEASAAQVALAWLLHQGPDIIPIPGTKRRHWLEQNAAAASLSLTSADLQTLAQLNATSGARYTERGLATIDR